MTESKFKIAANKIQQQMLDDATEAAYISDPKNWLLIHSTAYKPQKNAAGQLHIKPLSAATDFQFVRNTIHTTINRVVGDRLGAGKWSDQSYIVLMPYNDTVAQNGLPANVMIDDTYFSVPIDTGLVLPPTAHIMRTDNNLPQGTLFEIRGNETVFKQNDFTPDEIEMILPYLPKHDAEAYQMYASGNLEMPNKYLTDDENKANQQAALEEYLDRMDDVSKKMYASARDKNAFWRGIFQQDANAILASYVKNVALNATATHMGYKLVSRSNAVDNAVNQFALKQGFRNGLHDASLHAEAEGSARAWRNTIGKDGHFGIGLYNITDFDQLYNTLVSNVQRYGVQDIITALVTNSSPNLRAIFEYSTKNSANKFLDPDEQIQSITAADKNLSDAMRKYATRAALEFERWRNKLQTRAGYDKFIQRLAAYQTTMLHTNSIER